MPTLQLDVPQRRVNDAGIYQVDLRELRGWIDALPYGDAVAAGQMLLTTLTDLNRSALKRDGRLEPVRVLWVGVARLLPALRGHYIKSPLPLGARESAAYDTAWKLINEAAHGFKLATLERLELVGPLSKQDKPLSLALQRAMLCLSWLKLECYNTYHPVPAYVWRDFYHLYELAEISEVTEISLPAGRVDDQAGPDVPLTISQVFSRAISLSLANPFNLLQGEAEYLFRVMGVLGDTVTLGETRATSQEAGFYADFATDVAPRLIERSDTACAGLRLRKIITSGIAHTLRTVSRDELPDLEGEIFITPSLRCDALRRAAALLMPQRGRAEKRSLAASKLSMVYGLSNIHQVMGARLDAPPDETEREFRNEGTPLLTAWPDAGSEHSVPMPSNTDRWMRKNESQGGLQVFSPTRPDSQVRTGDLAAYYEATSASALRLAGVRWIKTRANGGLDVGLKGLGAAGSTLFVRAIRGHGVNAGYVRALLVTSSSGGYHVLTSAGLFDASSVLVLNYGHALSCARVVSIEYTSHLFAEFAVELLNSLAV